MTDNCQRKPLSPSDAAFRETVIAEMRSVFGPDTRRIDHALGVLEAAETLLAQLGGDARVVLAAAILHDIGITTAERVHGSSAAKFQELEGPPIARKILEKLRLDPARIDHICDIIANHHSAGGRDTIEFRILWDADMIINLMPESPVRGEALDKLLGAHFRTAPGRALAAERFGGVR
ncbi:MAG: HD domain-containing protein [Planctomycetota bacterium]|nr:HD domain-containing protein [Planctomycetota bacterium]